MLSMSKPLAYGQAENYLQKENYYQKNSEKGYFFGNESILEKLGITKGEEVTTTKYLHLLQGVNPINGEALLKNSEDPKRRVGIDLTTSAPKSVSIIEEYLRATGKIEEADKIREAHQKANTLAMQEMEQFCKTRIYDEQGLRVATNEVEIVRAEFMHDTSRENKINGNMDMQLHTHNMLFNLVLHKSKFYSLSNEELYKNKMFLGQVYRNELAKNMQELGYQVEITDYEKGFFEIKGIDREQVLTFSGRSADIKSKLEEYKSKYPNMNEEALENLIAQTEKIAKRENVDREVILEENKARMEEIGINEKFINDLKGKNKTLKKDFEKLKEHIINASKFLEENNSAFTKFELFKEALKYGLDKNYSIKDYEECLENHITDKELIKFTNGYYSTPRVYEAEQEVVNAINDKNYSISEKFGITKEQINSYIENSKFISFTDGQREMFENILTSNHQFTIVQGSAGTGKTFSMEALEDFLKGTNVEIVGMSFTGKATENLQNDSNIFSNTIAKFIINENKRTDNEQKQRLIIIDEAGMSGSLDLYELQKIAKKNNDKIIFVGDKKQLQAVSQGKLFSETQKKSENIVFLEETKRFKTEFAKELVSEITKKNIQNVFKLLIQNDRLVEASKEEQIKSIVKEYTKSKNKNKVGLLVSKNEDRKNLNKAIREALKLEKKSINFKLRETVNFRGIEKKFNISYEKGMYITIGKQTNGFRIGETLKVIGKDESNKKILLVANSKGTVKKLDLYNNSENFSIFKDVEKGLAKGEIIKFNKNIERKDLKVKNGERGTIKSIKANGEVKLTNGKKFNLNEMNFVDYGYVFSTHEAQGQTFNKAFAMVDTQMANIESAYSNFTRMKYDFKVFTTDKEDLEKKIGLHQQKTSTVDLEKEEKIVEIEVEKAETNNKKTEKINTSNKGVKTMVKLSICKDNNINALNNWETVEITNYSQLASYMKQYPYSNANFENGYRNSNNATSFNNLLIFDIDNDKDKPQLSIEGAKELLESHNISAMILPSKSHNISKNGHISERFRIVIPTNKATSLTDKESYREFQRLIAKTLKLENFVDTKALNDKSRFYYTSPKEAAHIVIKSNKLMIIDNFEKVAIKNIETKNNLKQQESKKIDYIKNNLEKYTTAGKVNTDTNSLTFANVDKLLNFDIKNLINHFEKESEFYKEGSYSMIKTATSKYSIIENNVAFDFKSDKAFNSLTYLKNKLGTTNLNKVAREMQKLTGEKFLEINTPAIKKILETSKKFSSEVKGFEDLIKLNFNVKFCKLDDKNLKIADVEIPLKDLGTSKEEILKQLQENHNKYLQENNHQKLI